MNMLLGVLVEADQTHGWTKRSSRVGSGGSWKRCPTSEWNRRDMSCEEKTGEEVGRHSFLVGAIYDQEQSLRAHDQ